MRDDCDFDVFAFIVNRVDDTPVPDANPPEFFVACELHATWGSRIFCEPAKFSEDAALDDAVERPYLPLGCR